MTATTKTIYTAMIKVTVTVYGPHNPALVASTISAALPTDARTDQGSVLHFDPCPHVFRALTFRKHGRGWRQVADAAGAAR